jgi:outer membrane protein assembly factor BamB
VRGSRAAAVGLAGALLGACSTPHVIADSTRTTARAAGAPLAAHVAWRADVGSPGTLEPNTPQTGGCVVSHDGSRVFAALADGDVAAFDASDGRRVWSTPMGGALTGAPALVDGRLYVGGADGTVRALDPAGGTEFWRYRANASFGGTPSVTDDTVYVVGSDSRLHAIDRATGAGRWNFERPPARGLEIVGQAGVVPVGEDVCAGFADGSLACVDAATGDTRWVADLSAGARRLADVDTTPVLVADRLVAASFAGGVSAVSTETGETLWTAPERGVTALVAGDGAIVAATSESRLVWIDPADGAVLRSLDIDQGGLSGLVGVGDVLVASAGWGGVYFVSADAPWVLNHVDPGTGISAAPCAIPGSAYLLSDGGYLTRIDFGRR